MTEQNIGLIKEEEYDNITDMDIIDDKSKITPVLYPQEENKIEENIKEDIKSTEFDYTFLKIIVALMFL